MPVFRHLFMLLCFGTCTGLFSQGVGPVAGGGFFAQQAREDAVFEQLQVFEFEQDEWDFWQDQRAYERQLSLANTLAFGEYMIAKRDAYRVHQTLCDQNCGHGDYYYLQASYYLQFGDEDAAYLAVIDGSAVSRDLQDPDRN